MVADRSSNTLPSSIYYFHVYAIPDKLFLNKSLFLIVKCINLTIVVD